LVHPLLGSEFCALERFKGFILNIMEMGSHPTVWSQRNVCSLTDFQCLKTIREIDAMTSCNKENENRITCERITEANNNQEEDQDGPISRSSSTDGCMGSLSNLFIFSEDTNEDREIADMDLDASCSMYHSAVQDMIDRPPAPSGAMFTLGHQDSYCGSESCDSFIWTQSHGTTVMNNTTKELKSARLPALSVPGGELSTVTITRSISSYEDSDAAAGAGGVGMIGMTSWHDNDEGAMSSPEF